MCRLFSFHIDTHNAVSSIQQHRRWSSTAFSTCIASEHSEARLLSILCLTNYLHSTQTLTIVNLDHNNIGAEGGQLLAAALQVNTVKLNFSPSHVLPTIFISHRHSLPYIFTTTTLALKEQSIWQVHCKWTRWGWTSRHLMSYLLYSFHIDTHNAGPLWQQHWRWRSTTFGKCITSELGETRLLYILCLTYYLHFAQTLITLNLSSNKIDDEGAQYLASALQVNSVRLDFPASHLLPIILISHRHSQRWILAPTRSVLKEHSIWEVHCKWTQWGSTSFHLMSYPLSSFHTDTHNTKSSRQQYPRWRSTTFGKWIASEPG